MLKYQDKKRMDAEVGINIAMCIINRYIVQRLIMDKQKWLLIIMIISVILSGRSYGGEERSRIHPESWYQENWCREHGGKTEVSLNDGTRADCVTPSHIIEFDFGDNWYESVEAVYILRFVSERISMPTGRTGQ